VHVAACKYWYEKYGAELAFIAFDTLEFFVGNPPTDEKTAIALATEHFLYCQDRITQGFDTVAALAGALMDSTVWYFWWD